MKAMEVQPDTVCYTVLINWHCKMDYLEDARKLIDEMFGNGLALDAFAYNALLSGYCNRGDIETAKNLVEEMQSRKIQLTKLTFSILAEKLKIWQT